MTLVWKFPLKFLVKGISNRVEAISKVIFSCSISSQNLSTGNKKVREKKLLGPEATLLYQSQVSILGPVGYGPTTLPLRHSDLVIPKRFSSTLALGLTVETSKRKLYCFGLRILISSQ
jgi:hypothetical protein